MGQRITTNETYLWLFETKTIVTINQVMMATTQSSK